MEATAFNIQKFSLHDGFGIRTTLFFKGCNLMCKWCANPESQAMQAECMQGKAVGRVYTLEEIVADILKDKPFYDKSGGGVTLSGGEPLLQAEFVLALCDALHKVGVTVGIETAANVPTEIFADVLKRCDFALIDLKHWDTDLHKQGTGAGNRQIIDNLRYALAQSTPVIVRIPMIPGFNNSDADARAFAALLTELGAQNVEVLPFHQLGENKYTQLGRSYDYCGVPQLSEQDATRFAGILTDAGLQVRVGS